MPDIVKRGLYWLAFSPFAEEGRRRRTYALIALALFTPFLALVMVSFIQLYRGMTTLALERRVALAGISALYLQERFDHLLELGVSYTTHVDVQERVARGDWKAALKILEAIPVNFPSVDRIFLTDIHGTETAASPELIGGVGKNFAFRDWYAGVTKDWKPYVSEVYKRTAEPQYNVVAIAIPIFQDDSPAGILVLQIRIDRFFEWSNIIAQNHAGFTYFVDQYGHIAGHPPLDPQGAIVDFSQSEVVERIREGGGIITTDQTFYGGRGVAAYQLVPDYGWGVVLEQPYTETFEERTAAMRLAILLYVFIFLLNAFLIFVIIRTLNIMRLMRA